MSSPQHVPTRAKDPQRVQRLNSQIKEHRAPAFYRQYRDLSWDAMHGTLLALGLLAIAVGALLMILGILLTVSGARHKGETRRVKTAGFVLIGPFPIIFGDKDLVKYSAILLLVSVALTIMLMPFLK